MEQVQGLAGRMVDSMIRRSVRKGFRGVYWIPPAEPLPAPVVLVPNHHGWHDGYVMYHAITKMNLVALDWIQEFDSFPLFAKVGGMPFPKDNPTRRAMTVRKTIRLMREEKRSLILFAEQELHRPPEILPFGKALQTVVKHVPEASVVPVAIRYELSLHERPECFLMFGKPLKAEAATGVATRLAVKSLLDELAVKVGFGRDQFEELAKGTLDVNERMDMRQIPGFREK
jgi:1-acyl-sn-glycerol-3-phosphate acyltransferase